MTWTHNSNGTNPLHKEGPCEQRRHDDTGEQREATDRQRGQRVLRIRTQHCILCQAETVGACLICHRPLCEQCGRSDDEFLRCRAHQQDEVEALRSTLRQAALTVIGTKRYVDDLVALRNRVLHEVSAALLRSYVEHTGRAPSPSHIQQMRRMAMALWTSLAWVEEAEEQAVMDIASTSLLEEEMAREANQARSQEMRQLKEEEPR
jgi:hypothetical protein